MSNQNLIHQLVDALQGALVPEILQYHSTEWIAKARKALDAATLGERAAQPQAASVAQPFGYISKAEAEKLSDKRLGGLGMMISKDPAEHRMAIYLAPPAPTAQPLTDADIDRHLDAVLRASGSGLGYYSTPKTVSAMQRAMRAAMLHLAGDTPAEGA